MKRLSLTTLAILFAAACSSAGNAPTIEVFTAVPSSIALGDSAQLIFAAESGSTLSIDQGVGDVTGKTSVTGLSNASRTVTVTLWIASTATCAGRPSSVR